MGRIIGILISVIALAFTTISTYWFTANDSTFINRLNRLPILFAPANYTYLLFFVVLLGLLFWIKNYAAVQNTRHEITLIQTGLFGSIVALQIAFLLLWQMEVEITAIVLYVIQLLVTYVLYLTYPISKESIIKRWPIALFFSYMIFVFFIALSYVFVTSSFDGFGLSTSLWTVLFMTVGVGTSLHLRFHHDDRISPLVFIWGYVGIIVHYGLDELFIFTAGIFLIGVLFAGNIFLNKKRNA